jgi:hypothetical protein
VARRAVPGTLAEHPSADRIRDTLLRLPYLTPEQLSTLARTWRSTPVTTTARRRALAPGSPLVMDVLSVFDLLTTMYADELWAEGPHVVLPARTTRDALKAVRDAVAAVYAAPVLTRWEYLALSRPWRRAMRWAPAPPADRDRTWDALDRLLGGAAACRDRCHDAQQLVAFDAMVVAGLTRDASGRAGALEQAWTAAVACGRHRMWALLRRAAADTLRTGCARCRRTADGEDDRVAGLVTDAAVGLLVGDLLSRENLRVLLEPVSGLLPRVEPAQEGLAEG